MPYSRRRFLQRALALTAVPLGVRLNAAAPAGEGLTTYQLGPRIWIRWNNRLLTVYRAHRSQKYPYLYPVAGPLSGRSLTTETSLPYPHHRSLFFGCDRINGGNYWQEDFATGQILSTGPTLGQRTAQSVEILDACDWQKPGGKPVMKDRRRITVTVASTRLHFIDWKLEWTAVEDVAITKTNHSLFSARAALDITPHGRGKLLNAEGQSGERDTFGKPSAWCGFHGQRERAPAGLVEGIAILDHPRNPWSPCPWFTRDYGFMSPTPMNFVRNSWKLAAGQSVTLRYRVVLHADDPATAGLDAIHRDWAAA